VNNQRNPCNPFNQRYSITTDVLIIGGGAAGIRAALAASEEGVRVTLVTKAPLTESGSTFTTLSPGWGIQALAGRERTPENLEAFYNDIMRVGLGQCDPTLVRILVEESGPRFEDLLSFGIRFRKDTRGNYLRAKGCFNDYERAFLTESLENINESLLSKIRRSPVRLMLGQAASLITSDEICWGAWIITSNGRTIEVCAKATILATGGGAGLFRDHLVTDDEAGEGYALAHRAGAKCTNLEFIQFMLGLRSKASRRFLSLPDLRLPGVLKDSEGLDHLETNIPDPEERSKAVEDRLRHFPFSTRDASCKVDLAVARTRREKRQVLWNKPDPTDGPWEVMHLAHAFNGGVRINERAESSITGLFAAGEVAAGPHGADRIGGCMMTATQVFGARAGKHAALRAKHEKASFPQVTVPEFLDRLGLKPKGGTLDSELLYLFDEAKTAFSTELMLLRDHKGIMNCLSKIREATHFMNGVSENDPRFSAATKNRLSAMALICEAALKRKESLGPHYRTDARSYLFPK